MVDFLTATDGLLAWASVVSGVFILFILSYSLYLYHKDKKKK